MEEAGQGIELECSIFLIILRAAQSPNETLLNFYFLSSEAKRISLGYLLRIVLCGSNTILDKSSWDIPHV